MIYLSILMLFIAMHESLVTNLIDIDFLLFNELLMLFIIHDTLLEW